MNDVVKRIDPFHIEANPYRADDRTRVLKQGETFAIFDRFGDIGALVRDQQGIVHEGTRYVCYSHLRLNDERPLLLSSTIKRDNSMLAVDLTNPDIYRDGELILPQGTLHLFRSKFIWNGVCYERIRVCNFSLEPVAVELLLQFDADYADIFQLRGMRRAHTGARLPTKIESDFVQLGYQGLDGLVRHTEIRFSVTPTTLSGTAAEFKLTVEPKAETAIGIAVVCIAGAERPHLLEHDDAMMQAGAILSARKDAGCRITTSDTQFNNWIDRSGTDLYMMVTDTEHGAYPYAGVPWYSTVFGRDGIITALEFLWVDSSLARGVLSYLAANQATEVNVERDAEPGKILHETRKGEMAALGEVPFQRYYGSVDSTPLFLILAGAYFRRTGDRRLIESLWPHIELALQWIDRYGDTDRDGFVEYQRHSTKGLVNQGWKDSHDAVFDEHGALAQGSIALCEVQSYVYGAKRAVAELACMLGRAELAARLEAEAATLKTRFNQVFWCDELNTYALALDGDKRPLRVRNSNAGHALFTGIADAGHAERLANSLLVSDSFSGWGIRTIASSARRYNPMSYHNGSIWPHDNALIAYGLGRYGFKEQVSRITEGLLDTSTYVELNRLPELFCGFIQRAGEAPTLYPVACSPQAWSAGAVFLLLQACLGLEIQAHPRPRVCFAQPVLPADLHELKITNLRVGDIELDISVVRHDDDVSVHVPRRSGHVEVVVLK